MSNFAVYLIILLAVAAIVVFLCIYAYNKRLDKVTSGEVRDTHSAIPEPGTAVGTIYRIVLILIVIMLFFSLSTANGKLTAMQNDIDSLERSVSSLTNQVYDLEQKLSENGKRVENTNVEILDPDYEALWNVCDRYNTTGFYPFAIEKENGEMVKIHELPRRRDMQVWRPALGAQMIQVTASTGRCPASCEPSASCGGRWRRPVPDRSP